MFWKNYPRTTTSPTSFLQLFRSYGVTNSDRDQATLIATYSGAMATSAPTRMVRVLHLVQAVRPTRSVGLLRGQRNDPGAFPPISASKWLPDAVTTAPSSPPPAQKNGDIEYAFFTLRRRSPMQHRIAWRHPPARPSPQGGNRQHDRQQNQPAP